MAALTRLSLDGYGARRAGSFAGKSLIGVPLDRIVKVLAVSRAIISDAVTRQIAASATDRSIIADATDRTVTL